MSAYATSSGALALAQVVAGRLAGLGRVAEHAEHVVAQLERLAERQAVRAVDAGAGRAPAPASAAPRCSGRSTVYFALLYRSDAQRALDRAGRRAPARAGRGTARPSARCASRRTPACRRAATRRRARSRTAARRPRPGTGRRAGSRRRCRTRPRSRATRRARCSAREPAVHGRRAAAGVRAVHDVVVDQRAGLQQLQRGGGAHHRVAVRAAGAAPAPVAERRPQPLAAGQQGAGRLDHGARLGADAAEPDGLRGTNASSASCTRGPQVLGLQRGRHAASVRREPVRQVGEDRAVRRGSSASVRAGRAARG